MFGSSTQLVRGVPDGLGDGVSGIQSFASALDDRERQYRASASLQDDRHAARARLVSDSLDAVGLSGIWRALSLATVRRDAAAGRDRARSGLSAEASADGRTVCFSRCPDARRSGRSCRRRSSQFGITIVFITHDIDEAVYLSDRVIVLSRPPSTVLAKVDIDLARPRDQIKTKAMPQFVEKRSMIAKMIRRPFTDDQ